jgi:PhzF family phenazine biosynthesis protein
LAEKASLFTNIQSVEIKDPGKSGSEIRNQMKFYQVDAFAEQLFTGNPAGVVPLKKWINASLMQQIAMENNLAETAFFVKKGKDFEIRWFTPGQEINLCGHATLASAWVLFERMKHKKKSIVFHSKSGPLRATRKKEKIILDFPSWPPERWNDFPATISKAVGEPEILGVYRNRDIIVELKDEQAVKDVQPDFGLLRTLPGFLMVTAPGKDVDFVSRFFAPAAGIDEDPVTGSAHSQLIPFWSYKLNKKELSARQLSPRGGYLDCTIEDDRVTMAGKCVPYLEGEIFV